MMENSSVKLFDVFPDNDNIVKFQYSPKMIFDNNNSNNVNELSDNTSETKSRNIDDELKILFQECWNKYEIIFYNTIVNEHIEEGYISNSQNLFETIKKEYGDVISSQFLNQIYIKYAQNNKLVKSLLYILAEQKLVDLHGIELGVVLFAIPNKDYEIKDLALQCFEKWKEPRYLDLLKSITIGVEYLDDYLNYIIKKTEEKRLLKCI